MINDGAIARVERLVTDACAKGAKVVTGGAREATETRFYRPTVLTGITPAMEIAREEIFGPVAALTKFETEDEAIGLANETPFGLAAYVFTRDLSRALRVSERIESGRSLSYHSPILGLKSNRSIWLGPPTMCR